MIKNKSNFFLLLILFVSLITFFGNHFFNLYSTFKNSNFGNFEIAVNKKEQSSSENIYSKNKIYFLGDLMMARDVERRLKREGVDYAFSNINFATETRAYVVANFEGSIPEFHKPTPDFGFQFSVDETFLPFLHKAGITHVSLANNHALDFGQKGHDNSFDKLKLNNLVPFGHPSSIASTSISFLEAGKYKVALIGLMSIDKFLNQEDLENVFSDAKADSDIQIVVVHWGNEYDQNQSNTQRSQATIFSKLGADLIIGHHPHVVQGIEWIDNTLVFYSLGNFLFDQYFSRQVQEGLIIEVGFKDEIVINLLPISSINKRVQPNYMSLQNKDIFLKELADLSQEKLQNEILNGVIVYGKNLATSSEVVIMNR